jgi:hypothetical protein
MLAIVNASISLAAIVRSSSGRPPSVVERATTVRRFHGSHFANAPTVDAVGRPIVRPLAPALDRTVRTNEGTRESSVDRDARSIDGRGVRDVDARGDE